MNQEREEGADRKEVIDLASVRHLQLRHARCAPHETLDGKEVGDGN